MDIDTLQVESSRGDESATEQLFEILTSRFRLFARHSIRNAADAEEVVQEALMVIHANHRTITFTTSFSAWACRVLENRILDYHRRNQRERARFSHVTEVGYTSAEPSVDAGMDLKRRLVNCMRLLCYKNARYGRILALHYQGYETVEICERLGLKLPTFYSALSKARDMLERCLDQGDMK